jgi:chromosome segregation ATPase
VNDIERKSTEREVERLANDLAGEWRERAEKAEAEITAWKTRLVEETARLRQINRDLRAENERLKAERQAVLDVVNLYGDETLHKALDGIGWPSVPELVERSRALGPVMEAQGERVAQGLREAADRMRGGE